MNNQESPESHFAKLDILYSRKKIIQLTAEVTRLPQVARIWADSRGIKLELF